MKTRSQTNGTIKVLADGVDKQVILKRCPDRQGTEYNIAYRCLTPIWHPAVFPVPMRLNGMVFGTSQEDVMRQIRDIDYARESPGNIDAAIDWFRNKQRFSRMNQTLITNTYGYCGVCEKDLPTDEECANEYNYFDYSCLNGCVSHRICVQNLTNCPNCERDYIK